MKRTKRFLALLLTCALLLGLVGTALAEEEPAADLAAATNIAQGKTITASDRLNDTFPATNMVDGSMDTRWVSAWDMKNGDGTSAHRPKTVILDLGAGKSAANVESIVVSFFHQSWATDYTISTAATNSENTTWTTVYTCANRTNDTSGQVDTIAASSLSQTTLERYVKFYFQEINLNFENSAAVGVLELAINGELVDAPSSGPSTPSDTTPDGNLARLSDVSTAHSSDEEAGTHYPSSRAVDGSKDSAQNNDWWSSSPGVDNDHDAKPWMSIDLGAVRTVGGLVIYFRGDDGASAINGFKIQKSDDGATWTDVQEFPGAPTAYRVVGGSAPHNTPVATYASLTNKVQTQHIRILATGFTNPSNQWNSMSIYEVEVYRDAQTPSGPNTPSGPTTTPAGNLCRPSDGVTVTATADSVESGTSYAAEKAIDGNSTANTSRWASAVGAGDRWLQVDLGTVRQVSTVKLFWQHDSVTAYNVKISSDGTTWTTVKEHSSGRITALTETVTFDQQNARYIKITATGHNDQGSGHWDNVSIYEVEVYRDAQAAPAASVLGGVTLGVVNGKVAVTSDVPDGFTVSFAANYEQVVGADHTVYTPLVDTAVKFDVTVSSADGSDTASSQANSPVSLTIPGAHTANEGNDKPTVIPELTEWYSSAAQSGQSYALTASSKIVAPAALSGVAGQVKADVADLFGLELTVADSGAAAGDIILALDTAANRPGYDKETYLMEIADQVTITAVDPVGVYWGTRSILQILKLSGDRTAPQGTARDYPEFKLRGFILDVGRKPFSMDFLQEIVKNMAWYKMNDFHVHLNDNLIFMEDYGVNGSNYQQEGVYEKANKAYSAFRLESDIQEEEGALPLAARDYHYTKAEYKSFVEESAALGVTIVSEIDVPAHAKAVVDAFPSVRLFGNSGHPWNDHLDLGDDTYAQSLQIVKNIFDEYIDSGVFGASAHFGADEYYASHPAYRRFVKDMIAYLNGKPGLTNKRVWGSLSSMSNSPTQQVVTSEEASGIQMNVWSASWARPADMFALGFDLINCLDGANYIVPAAGYYGDKYGPGKYTWDPNNFGGVWIPASSSQMLGGAFAIWNDAIDTRANGIDERDVFERFYSGMPYYACALWGRGSMTQNQASEAVAVTSYAPQTNPTHAVDLAMGCDIYASYDFTTTADDSGNGRNLTLSGAAIENETLHIAAAGSYAETGLDKLPWGSKLSFRVNVTQPGILFESDAAYDEYTIRALPVDGDATKWRLGFGRELYDFHYEHEFDMGQWVQLALVNNERSTELYIGDSEEALVPIGEFKADANSNTEFRGVTFTSGEIVVNAIRGGSSLSIPVARIGSKTAEGFVGELDDVVISAVAIDIVTPVSGGAYDIDPAGMTAAAGSQAGNDAAANVLDGNTGSIWHTAYGVTPMPTLDDFWITLDLGAAQQISGLRYLPRTNGTNGIITRCKIEVSDDGTNWTTVVENNTFLSTANWHTATFDAVTARHVRFSALATLGDTPNTFASAAELRVCRTPSLEETDKVQVQFAEESYPLVNGAAQPHPTVLIDGMVLVEGRDYTLAWSNNTAAGAATVSITGTGMYAGTASATFAIAGTQEPTVPPDLANATVTLPQTSYTHTGSAIEPEVTVVLNGVTLAVGTDYTVSYAGNVNVGTATVTVDGTGAYTGTKSVTFTITTSGGNNPSGGGDKPSGGGSKPSSSPSGAVTPPPAEKPGQESVTTTVTDPATGAVTVTTLNPDGSSYKKVTETDGTVTETAVDAAGVRSETVTESSGVVTATTTQPNGQQTQSVDIPGRGKTITVTDPMGEVEAKVLIPDVIAPSELVFDDIPDTHWAAGAVNTVASLGLFQGTSERQFSGSGDMTRGMVATVLHRLSGEVSKMPAGFQDVVQDGYYASAVDWAAAVGVVQGVGSRQFDPDRSVTRQELVTMLYRFAEFLGVGIQSSGGAIADFADSADVPGWATNAMDWAVINGLIQGRSGDLLAPTATATRAEVAIIMDRFLGILR